MHAIKIVTCWSTCVCTHMCVPVRMCRDRQRQKQKGMEKETEAEEPDPNSKNMYKLFSNLRFIF